MFTVDSPQRPLRTISYIACLGLCLMLGCTTPPPGASSSLSDDAPPPCEGTGCSVFEGGAPAGEITFEDTEDVEDLEDTEAPTAPCIAVSSEGGLDFGEGYVGSVSTLEVTISNCSEDAPLILGSVELTGDDAFFTDLDEGASATLEPGEALGFTLGYAPTDEALSTGLLVVRSNDPARLKLEVPLAGRGVVDTCPSPVVMARVEGMGGEWATRVETAPLATIEFSAESADDGALSYEWTIIDRPADSTSRLSPSDTARSPSLFLDLAGSYVVELRTFNANGTPSCETALVTIQAVPVEDIVIELTWDTPGDFDQTDTGVSVGSDMDLHFLHPRGSWNVSPWDCYWLNIEPNWGAPRLGTDDPSLNIDDTDGSGPEQISLNAPEEGAYKVGVHYFSDHGYGASLATVRIYLGSVLVAEFSDTRLERSGGFWEVATIRWSNGGEHAVEPLGHLYEEMP